MYVGRYVGLVANRIKNMSLLTIGVNLVLGFDAVKHDKWKVLLSQVKF